MAASRGGSSLAAYRAGLVVGACVFGVFLSVYLVLQRTHKLALHRTSNQ